MIKINLVPKEILARKVKKQQALQAAVAGAAALTVVVGVTVMHLVAASRLEKKQKDLKVEYDKKAAIVAQVKELEQEAKAVKDHLGAINNLVKGRTLYPSFMEDLAGTLPAGVWLTTLNTGVKEGNQLDVKLSAVSTRSEGVSEWLRALERSKRFDDAKLSGINISNNAGVKQNAFSLAMGYKNPNL